MNAREIVSLLLEAEDMSAGDRTGVYIFGPGLPPDGYGAKDLPEAFDDFERSNFLAKGAKDKPDTMQQLVNTGYSFFFKRHPGSVEVISRQIPVRTTTEGKEQVMQFLGLQKEDPVQYRTQPTGNVVAKNVEQVLFGSKQAEKEAEKGEPKWKQDQQAKADLSEFPATGQGYSGDFMPVEAPVSLGFTFDLDSKEGIIVKEVHPGGPAAQAGLQAGDVIVQTGEFVSRDGEDLGPFYVYNQKHLEYVLRKLDPTYPITFRVIRGDRELWLPMQAQQKQQQQPQQQQQARATQTSMARKLFAKEKRPRQRRLNFKPNEVNPTRQTGNAPANVSSLT